MAVPKFVLGESQLQFSRGLRYPVEKPNEKVQALDRTGAGSLQVESLGLGIRTRILRFRNLPQADYEALDAWFDDIANGAANSFTYIDEDGVSMTVRIITPKLNFAETALERFSGELLLELV